MYDVSYMQMPTSNLDFFISRTCVSKGFDPAGEVGQYMQALNGYFHGQGTGEYWRPFGDTKNQRNTWAKKTHSSRRFSVFFCKKYRMQYDFICPNHFFGFEECFFCCLRGFLRSCLDLFVDFHRSMVSVPGQLNVYITHYIYYIYHHYIIRTI